ncbi:MAG: hypothetical protein IPM29_03680 [Planctomycetes bacterium]|nr:hypothetical protein [Planctomycetota bacterium]
MPAPSTTRRRAPTSLGGHLGKLALVAPLLLATAPAAAQQSVPLLCGVPADVCFVVHGADTPTPDPAWRAFESAVGQLADSGVHRDLFELIALSEPRSARASFMASVDEWFALLGKVDWPLLVSKEVAFAYRLAMPMPEYVYLFRVPEPHAATQSGALRELLTATAERLELGADAVTSQPLDGGAGELTTLTVPGSPLQLVAGRAGDVVLLSTSARLARSSANHLASGDTAGTLAGDSALRADLALLPQANESTVFVDFGTILEFATPLLRLASGALADAPESPESAWARTLVGAGTTLLEDLGDQLESVLVVTTSDGSTVTSTSLLRHPPGADSARLAALWADRQPWRDWARLVPSDATRFWFEPGLDPAEVADYLAELAETHARGSLELPPGTRALLDAMSGELGAIDLAPRAGATDACPLGETIVALRLDDPQLVAARLPGLLDDAVAFLHSREQAAAVQSLDDLSATTLAIRALPWLRPTFAVRGDLLLVATSPDALRRVDAAGRQRSPAPHMHEAVAGGGLLAFGTDQVQTPAFGLGDLLGAAGLTLALLPDELRAEPAIPILARIATKLAPALRALESGYRTTWTDLPAPAPDVSLSRVVWRYDVR